MKALVTRPDEDSGPVAAALAGRGIDPVVEPMLSIRFATEGARVLAPLLEGAQAVLFTSANGVRAFAAASGRRDLSAFAVGDATANAALGVGFGTVTSAGGTVEDLAGLVRDRLNPRAGALVHAAGTVVAGDLAGLLGGARFELRRAVLYEAVPVPTLSLDAAAALGSGAIGLALFFSPRTAATFVRLVREAGIEARCAGLLAIALSPAAAVPVAGLVRNIHVARVPTMSSLLEALDRALAELR